MKDTEDARGWTEWAGWTGMKMQNEETGVERQTKKRECYYCGALPEEIRRDW